ncbi:hypothetical protein H2200_007696 [Cladophialophora chaetospira]|uniref:Uncharacterized protein n=1 Tax=Cladophialophora chaetospira TaxID=386627 RepID=A0AA39CGU6_9EURO|nr:hypothetical protein H2200_007696 [Cladophialophora chaetospira]
MAGYAYQVDAERALLRTSYISSFSPIPALNRTDADVVMYFLLNEASYLGPVFDPWFEATIPVPFNDTYLITDGGASNGFTYSPNKNASVMACTQQTQYCNHDSSRCSALTGVCPEGQPSPTKAMLKEQLQLNKKQEAIFSRLWLAAWQSDMYQAAGLPVGTDLLASSAAPGLTPALPDNQWILEMQHNFILGLISMQMQVMQYATGPPDTNDFQYLTRPNANESWMCNNQVVQNTGYTSFSELGLVLVFVIGGCIILVNQLISAIFGTKIGPLPKNEWDRFYNLSLVLHEQDPAPTSDSNSSVQQVAKLDEKVPPLRRATN